MMDTISIGTTRSLGGKKQRQITILVDNDREKTGVVERMRRIETRDPVIIGLHQDMLLATCIPWKNEHNHIALLTDQGSRILTLTEFIDLVEELALFYIAVPDEFINECNSLSAEKHNNNRDA